MEKSVPLNRPQLDLDPTGLLNDVEGPCEMEWRDYDRFQEGFSIVKTFIENKYKGVTLSIHDEPHEKHLGILMNDSSPYDYVGTFWKLKLEVKMNKMSLKFLGFHKYRKIFLEKKSLVRSDSLKSFLLRNKI